MRRNLFALSLVILLSVIAAPLAPARAAEAQSTRCVRVHTVAYRETLYRIARAYGTSVSALTRINGLPNPNRIYVGQVLCVAVEVIGAPHTYIVQRGDTLIKIGRRFGVDPYVLARYNNILNPNRIEVGLVLLIPDVTIQ